MLLGKKPKDSEKSAAEKELEERVDAMMSVERSHAANSEDQAEQQPDKALPQAKTESQETSEQKSAPALPAKLLKKVEKDEKPSKAAKTAKPPIVIKLADPVEDKSQTADKNAELSQDKPIQNDDRVKVDTSAITSTDEEELADPFDDEATDEAVEEITANEADTLLAVEDAIAARRKAASTQKPPGVISTLFWFVIFLLVLGIGYVSFRYLGL